MRKTPVVMGVLSMVFGGIQVLMTGVGLASAPFSKQMMGGMGKAFSGLPRREGEPDVGAMFEQLGRLTEELKLYTYLTGFAMLAFFDHADHRRLAALQAPRAVAQARRSPGRSRRWRTCRCRCGCR